MIQSNCDVHSIKHYYITSLSIYHVHIVTLSLSAGAAGLSWAETQLYAFEISLYTLASFCAGLFATAFQEFLTTLDCHWKSGPAWSPRWIICHSLPTPWIWWWNFWLSNDWLSPDVPCLVNSTFHVLFNSMQCWRNVFPSYGSVRTTAS